MSKPKVAVGIDVNGEMTVSFCGDVDVYWIDERTPNDRVFKSSNQISEKLMAIALDSKVIGFTGDGSEAENKLLKQLEIRKPSIN